MLAVFLFLMIFPSFCCETNEWKGITPLKSTRADVEKILGSPLRPSNQTATYKTKNETVFVVYAQRPCSIRPSSGSTPDARVVILEVSPTVPPKLSDLNVDATTFVKTIDDEKNRVIYSNALGGVTLILDRKEQIVMQISYSPEKSFADEFCKQNT